MKMPKIGFIGCGNMGGALVKAAAKAGFSKDIYICDNFAEKTEQNGTTRGREPSFKGAWS